METHTCYCFDPRDVYTAFKDSAEQANYAFRLRVLLGLGGLSLRCPLRCPLRCL
jgi:hypothetical protein